MAADSSSFDTLNDLLECSLCLEGYKNPRLLVCGHVFCEQCIIKLAALHPDRDIKCPACRKETKLSPEYKVTDLPRHYIVNELQERMAARRPSYQPQTERRCDVCEGKDTRANRRCQDCDMNLCERCYDHHQTVKAYGSHRTIPVTESLFCRAHQGVIVSMYCEECNIGVCRTCVIKTHIKHNCREVRLVAKETREKLKTLLSSYEQTNGNVSMINGLKQAAAKLRDDHQKYMNDLRPLQDSLQHMMTKLQQVEAELQSTLDAQLRVLDKHQMELIEQNSSHTSLTELISTLLAEDSDIDVIVKGQGFPEVFPLNRITSCSLLQPRVEGSLKHMRQVIQDLVAQCNVINEPHDIEPAKPIGTLTKLRDFPIKDLITGICLTKENGDHRVVVRTEDKAGPIKVYDYHGNLRGAFGGGIQEMCDGNVRDISHDTTRDLYLLPCRDKVIRCHVSGGYKDHLRLAGDLRGIVYISDEASYVVSVRDQHKLCVLDAETKQVVREFGTRGDEINEFNYPSFMCEHRVNDMPAVVVTDRRNQRIKVCDVRGDSGMTYGSEGSGDGHMLYPWDVCVDPAGRVVVCDSGNARVTSYWCEGSQEKWKRLLTERQLGGRPRQVDIDINRRLLFVVTGDNKVRMFSFD